MAIKFIQSNPEVVVDNQVRDEELHCKLDLLVGKLEDLEKHLAQITDIEIDEDDLNKLEEN